jgi:hypothetical protein
MFIRFQERATGFPLDTVFSFSIFWCNQTGDHQQEELAKIGYRSDMKILNSKNPFNILATCWNLL